jgi:hypothetical protein
VQSSGAKPKSVGGRLHAVQSDSIQQHVGGQIVTERPNQGAYIFDGQCLDHQVLPQSAVGHWRNLVAVERLA